MSVSTQITRLETAKAALKAAIEGYGVSVPTTTLLEGYAALVAAIADMGFTVPQGGTGLKTVTSGSYLKGAGTNALVPRTPAQVRSDLGIADHIVEIGTTMSGNLKYEKYQSGLMRAYGSFTETADGTGQLFGAYYAYKNFTIPTGFIALPWGHVDAALGGGAGWGYVVPDTNSNLISIGIMGNTNSATINFRYLELIGRWKA